MIKAIHCSADLSSVAAGNQSTVPDGRSVMSNYRMEQQDMTWPKSCMQNLHIVLHSSLLEPWYPFSKEHVFRHPSRHTSTAQYAYPGVPKHCSSIIQSRASQVRGDKNTMVGTRRPAPHHDGVDRMLTMKTGEILRLLLRLLSFSTTYKALQRPV